MDSPRRTALVTGASSGIGRAFAELLAGDGFDVVLVARSAGTLAEMADEFRRRFGVAASAITQDLAEPGAAQAVFDAVAATRVFVEVLINSAGYATYGPFADLPLEVERDEIAVNVVALTELTKLFLAPMLARKNGKILNVGSTAAFVPGPLMAVYYASKAYVLSFSEALANELAGTGVTVTCLAPGATESGFQGRAKMESSRLVKGRRLPDAMSVARAGYRAMLRGAVLEIPGLGNKVGTIIPRFLPRALVPHIVRRVQEREP
jgi:short-subunit dehydrogenase